MASAEMLFQAATDRIHSADSQIVALQRKAAKEKSKGQGMLAAATAAGVAYGCAGGVALLRNRMELTVRNIDVPSVVGPLATLAGIAMFGSVGAEYALAAGVGIGCNALSMQVSGRGAKQNGGQPAPVPAATSKGALTQGTAGEPAWKQDLRAKLAQAFAE